MGQPSACPHAAALAEQGYDQVKDELGWAGLRPRPHPAALINSVTAGCGLPAYVPD